MSKFSVLSRTLAGVGAACLVCIASTTVAQTNKVPVPVDIPPPPYGPRLQPPADPDQIVGIRIEDNGALITGPLDARRVYISLDQPALPRGFEGVWAKEAALCASAVEGSRTGVMPDGGLVIRPTEIVTIRRFSILKLFVALPSTFTMAMLNFGQNLQLPASRYRDAEKVLAIFAYPDGKRDYAELTLLPDDRLDIQNRNSHEEAERCTG